MFLATYKLMSATEATLKVIWITSKMILASEEDTATLKVIAVTTKMILASENVITATLNVVSSTTKDLGN